MRALALLLVVAGLAGCATPIHAKIEPRFYWKAGVTVEERDRDRAQAGLEASQFDTSYDPRLEMWRNQERSRLRRMEAVDSYYVSRGYRRVTKDELATLEAAEREGK